MPPTDPVLRTVLGPLSPTDVRGPVLPHEHLALDLDRAGDRAAVLDPVAHGRHVTAELASLRAEFGLGLVVELSCRGMGRNPRALARISAAAQVPVVAATGWYYEPFHPAEVENADVEQLTRVLLHEIDAGIDGGTDAGTGAGMGAGKGAGMGERAGGTRIRPGVIGEVGSHGDRPSPSEARCLRAAAAAARARGLSVATHAQLGRGGLAQLELLTGAGLDPHRVAIGHQDLLDEPYVHRELAAAGAYVAFDTVGKESYRGDADRLRLLLALLDAGYADRALLSCDISRHAYLESFSGHGYGHLFRTFLGRVRAAGVDEELIDLITRRNPLRFLTGGTESGASA